MDRRVREKAAGEGMLVDLGLGVRSEESGVKESKPEQLSGDERTVKRWSSVSHAGHRLSGETLDGLKEMSAFDTSIAF